MSVNGFVNQKEKSNLNGFKNDFNCQNKVRTSWNITASDFSKNTRNHIREISESMKLKPNENKSIIRLTIGDPTTFGNLRTSEETTEAIVRSVRSTQNNGYSYLQGSEAARKAIAEYSAHQSTEPISPENVFITNGCASALQYCIVTIAKSGQNILVPRPGYTLYQTQADGYGIETRYYDLLPEKDWEIDLIKLERLIDENTAALVVLNPSNPCGSVYSKEHLEKILAICEKHYLPIIADEIYEHMVFPGKKHIAISSLSENVPVLTCSGLTKRFLVPGWRFGWIIVHDRKNRLKDVHSGFCKISGRVLNANSLIQGALPDILTSTKENFFESVMAFIYNNAKLAFEILNKIPGLCPIMASGAMYMMVGIDFTCFPNFRDDGEFVEGLVCEQSVFCLPGACFIFPNFFRIVLTVPEDMLKEACNRIAEFCHKYYHNSKHINKILLSGAMEIDHNSICDEKKL